VPIIRAGRSKFHPVESGGGRALAAPAPAGDSRHRAREEGAGGMADSTVSKAEQGTLALRRAMQVLKVLAQSSPAGSRLVDIAGATRLPPSTVHRLLGALCAEGMALRETGGGRLYKLGPFALGLGPDAVAPHFAWLAALARPSLERLVQGTGCTAHLTVRVGRNGMSLDLVPGPGEPHPAFAPAGSLGFIGFGAASVCLLAALPEAAAEEILWENAWLMEQAGIRRATVDGLVADARRTGFCYSERAFLGDLCAVALCIPVRRGVPYAALSLFARTPRIEPDRLRDLVARLAREATAIARRIDRGAGVDLERRLPQAG
jgi:DNA-binding IclR family transcriptional regulator